MQRITQCRICGSNNLIKYLDLGSVPLANSLLVSQDEVKETYPVEVLKCQECHLSQLSVVVEPEEMFSEYAYHSSVSQTFKDHCHNLGESLKKDFKIHDFPLVVDIASNDGCCLKEFQKCGYSRLLGFEPAKNLGSKPYGNIEDGTAIPVVNAFFTEDVAKKIRGDRAGQGASFIIAQNVFAHVGDLHDFVLGIKWFLDDKGIFVAEFPYLPNLIEGNQFDTIYHEHLSYFLLHPLIKLFAIHDMKLFKVERLPIHGGSIRIYVSANSHPIDDSVTDMLLAEKEQGYTSLDKYYDFAHKVETTLNEFKLTIENIYHSGRSIMGYGASAKGISLLNYAGIKREWIHTIVDETEYKQGKYTPGTGIPIVPFEKFEYEHPYFILLLAWNFKEELLRKLWWNTGYYIIPIPKVEVF